MAFDYSDMKRNENSISRYGLSCDMIMADMWFLCRRLLQKTVKPNTELRCQSCGWKGRETGEKYGIYSFTCPYGIQFIRWFK